MSVYRKYADTKLTASTLEMIAKANVIIEEYDSKGFPLTLRQLYYQFVARGLIENKQTSYNILGNAISSGRLAGMVSWTAIEDRTRNLQGLNVYDSPAHAIASVKDNYRIDRWANQRFRPEVWVEKEALVGVIGGMCNKLRIDFFACKGYNSQSEQWRAGRRFANYINKGQIPIVFHLGDHDPSGIDMTRDNQERLSMFAGVSIQVVRLALNMDQIEKLQPPPNPAKVSDSRFEAYQRKYGDESWELDALNPEYIHGMIRDNVLKLRDQTAWDELEAQEANDIRVLDEMIEQIGGETDD